MTADAAGVSERERLIDLVHADACGCMSYGTHVRYDKERFGQKADAFLAAGFGDVAQAKAEAWEEGYAAAPDGWERGAKGDPFNGNPYRDASTA